MMPRQPVQDLNKVPIPACASDGNIVHFWKMRARPVNFPDPFSIQKGSFVLTKVPFRSLWDDRNLTGRREKARSSVSFEPPACEV
jgi:hypothetical protein